MKVFVDNHKFHYETENLTRVFFPNEKLEVLKQTCDISGSDEPFVDTRREISDGAIALSSRLSIGAYHSGKKKILPPDTPDDEQERMLAIELYNLLSEYTGITPPW